MADEYIRRVEAEEAIEEYCCRMCAEYIEVEGGCVSHAQHCPHLSGEEILKPVPAADVIPQSMINSLQEQISSIKRNVKSENSDYLTGYISALSAVEGMIAEMDGGAENG